MFDNSAWGSVGHYWGSCSYSVDIPHLMIFPFAFVWDLHLVFISLSCVKTEVSLHPLRRPFSHIIPSETASQTTPLGSLSSYLSCALGCFSWGG